MGNILEQLNPPEEDSALKRFIIDRRTSIGASLDNESIEEEMEYIKVSEIRKTTYLEDTQSITHLVN